MSPSMNAETTPAPGETASTASESNGKTDVPSTSGPWYLFDGLEMAQGVNMLGLARGGVVISSIFMSTSLVFLASQEAGCLNEKGNEVVEDCNNKVHGFHPAAFVANIAVIAGVLSALFMPVVGAMIDYTPYRKEVGALTASLLVILLSIQTGTVAKTWFYMGISQALVGFIFQMQVLSAFAYYPDIARDAGEKGMTRHTATFVMTQFIAEIVFLFLTIVTSLIFGLGHVATGQLSQGVSAIWCAIGFYNGWKRLPKAPRNNVLPEGHYLVTEGFVQIFRTARRINSDYKRGIRWFFLAAIFADSAASAFSLVAVVYLGDQLNMTATEIGIFFLITLAGTIPGSKIGARITARLNPKRSWTLSMVFLILYTAGGATLVKFVPQFVAYFWALGLGFLLGWFYPSENVFYSMSMPRGQEAELSGFFIYCTQIVVWLPPLLFSILVEANVSQTIGVISITVFFAMAICCLMCAASWEDILKETGRYQDDNVRSDNIEKNDSAEDETAPQSDVELQSSVPKVKEGGTFN